MDRKTDPRDIVVTTSSGKDVTDTQQLKGEAKEGKGMTEKNTLKEFESSTPLGGGKGGYGGLAS